MRKLSFLGASLVAVTLAGTAKANCWEECVLPLFGGCAKSVKVCDIRDPGRAAASLYEDTHAATSRILAGWHNIWGEVPEPIRVVLERYPVTILATIYPETREFALVIGALENYVRRALDRAKDSKSESEGKPEWYKQLYIRAQKDLLLTEGLPTSRARYDEQLSPDLSKYDHPWENFRRCMAGLPTEEKGEQCYKNFRIELAYVVQHDDT